VQPLFEAIAAGAGGEPCAALLGPGSAGHYVKMVHNGIEYGLIQLLAEAYDLLKRGLGLGNDDLAEVFAGWNQGALNGFLVAASAEVFRQPDEYTSGGRLVDAILAVAGMKGTGAWVSEEALALGSPTPTIDAAVWMRSLSRLKAERVAAAQVLPGPQERSQEGAHPGASTRLVEERQRRTGDQKLGLGELHDALYAGMLLTFAQGLALLGVASTAYGYGLDLEVVTCIWRAGSIIRAGLLEEVQAAYRRGSGLPNVLQDPQLSTLLQERSQGLRATVSAAAQAELPVPGFSSALAYLDGYRSPWLPANLVQALRDNFGAHGYERLDRPGRFHSEWGKG
jgi:6-phosphogluconate dehydrogenase